MPRDPVSSVRAYPLAMMASITLWLLALIALALVFRMEGKSLRHTLQHHAHKVAAWGEVKLLRRPRPDHWPEGKAVSPPSS